MTKAVQYQVMGLVTALNQVEYMIDQVFILKKKTDYSVCVGCVVLFDLKSIRTF